MDATPVLYPAFAMFFLVVVVFARYGRLRYTATRDRKVSIGYYRLYQDGEEPPELRVYTRHVINLFEMPTLFFPAVIIAYVTGQAGWHILGLAWIYVFLRCVHSWIHLTINDVAKRFWVFGASGAVLALLWLSLLLGLLMR